MQTTTTSANDMTHWTAATWRAHVANHHPAHAAASYAFHSEKMGRLAPSAKVITALTMVGKRHAKLDLEPVGYERAIELIEAACAHRAAMQRKPAQPPREAWVQEPLPLAAGDER